MKSHRWVFGYGSLVWRPSIAHLERAPGFVRGWARRFWQGSPDHRGVPHAPGRVVTLVPEAHARCFGVAYRVAERDWEEVVERLDDRESGGFERHRVPFHFCGTERTPVAALVYVAAQGNPNFLGPDDPDAMVSQMSSARGKSGSNAEYVLRLEESLRALDFEDTHVFSLAERVRAASRDLDRQELAATRRDPAPARRAASPASGTRSR